MNRRRSFGIGRDRHSLARRTHSATSASGNGTSGAVGAESVAVASSQPAEHVVSDPAGNALTIPADRGAKSGAAADSAGVGPPMTLEPKALLDLLHAGRHWLLVAIRAPLGPLPTEPVSGAARRIELDGDVEQTARGLRLALHRQGIAIGAVHCAPHFKAREFARLAFGRFEVRRPLGALSDGDLASVGQTLREPIERPITNALLCDPTAIKAVSGVACREGDTVLLRCVNGNIQAVGSVSPDLWMELKTMPTPQRTA